MSKEPKLRGNQKRRNSPYPLGEIPPDIAVQIGKQIVHRIAVGHTDITGDDFGGIFAKAIGGAHRGKPLGIADVTWGDCAWSVKTVQADFPFTAKSVRVISGRNDVNYSYGIQDSYADIAATGEAVLKIWNGRVDESLNEHDDLRIFIMIRNMSTLEFTLMEMEAPRYVPSEYEWKVNKNKNFLGFDRHRNEHRFTSQSGGRQFTVIHHVPASAYRFRITHNPGVLDPVHVLRLAKYEDSWIEAVTILPENAGQIEVPKAKV